MAITVLRLGHRPLRDKRISTHVGLVARAFGCSRMVYTGYRDSSLERSIRNVVQNWGGNFEIEFKKEWRPYIKSMKKRGYKILNLSMYGINLPEKINNIRKINKLLVIVGSEKVPIDVYDASDFNIAIGNNPHSEVSSLAIFLHEYFHGKEFSRQFSGAKMSVVPQERGKKILDTKI